MFNRKLFLIGLIVMLAALTYWHIDISDNITKGPRWVGIWNNPNTYGILLGVGSTLAIGLLVASLKSKVQSLKLTEFAVKNVSGVTSNTTCEARALLFILFIATGMMVVGLVMSYSRGAWFATTLGLLYLAWCYGKLSWRLVLPIMLAATTVVVVFWHLRQTRMRGI